MEILLQSSTPEAWLKKASCSLGALLSDHAECEKKAASTAMSLMRYFTGENRILLDLARLAREEMRHFDRVLHWLESLNKPYIPGPRPRYARSLHQHIRQGQVEGIVDKLIIAAIIEARSCERFSKLVPYLPKDLGSFYQKLYHAEKRHAEIYLTFAEHFQPEAAISARLQTLLGFEKELLWLPEKTFAFHSGVPDENV